MRVLCNSILLLLCTVWWDVRLHPLSHLKYVARGILVRRETMGRKNSCMKNKAMTGPGRISDLPICMKGLVSQEPAASANHGSFKRNDNGHISTRKTHEAGACFSKFLRAFWVPQPFVKLQSSRFEKLSFEHIFSIRGLRSLMA